MPSTPEATPATMIELVRENVLPDLAADFGAEGHFFDAGLDSMGVMQLVIILEERFNRKVEAAELSRANFRSGSALAMLVNGKAA